MMNDGMHFGTGYVAEIIGLFGSHLDVRFND